LCINFICRGNREKYKEVWLWIVFLEKQRKEPVFKVKKKNKKFSNSAGGSLGG
jgi:hypothetical protein